MAQPTPARTKACISYSRKDRKYFEELQDHLKFLQNRGREVFWADTEIKPGELWRSQIKEAIAAAKVALFLVSPAFFASEFIARNELPPVLEAAKVHETLVLSVILDHSLFHCSDLSDYQTINTPTRPLAALSPVERNRVWVQVAECVMEALQRPLRQPDPPPQRQPDPVPPQPPHKTKEQWVAEGNTHLDAGDFVKALAAYKQALQLDPKDAGAWNGMGAALRDLKRYEEALVAYEQALQLDPKGAYAWEEKGVALRDLKRYKEALDAFERALELAPNNKEAWNDKGNMLDVLHRYEEALAAYDQALNLYDIKNVQDSWSSYSPKTQMAYDKYDEWRNGFEQEYARVWISRANTLEQLGRTEEAQQARQKARELGWKG